MPELSDFLSCSVAPTGFQLKDFNCAVKDIFKTGIGKVGEEIQIDCMGEITGSDDAALASNVAAMLAATRSRGVDFVIKVKGAAEISVLAGLCVEGGPYIDDVNIEPGPGGSRDVKFKVIGKTFLDGGNVQYFDSHDLGVDERPDGLQQITWTGVMSGLGAADKFQQTIVAAFRLKYQADAWVISSKYKADSSGQHVQYTLTAQELANPFPTVGVAGGFGAVDGEGRYRKERDEQGRLTETWEFDLLLSPAESSQDLVDSLRAMVIRTNKGAGGDGVILRESDSQTLYKELHVQASFTLLRGGDGDRRMDFSQSFDLQGDQDAWDLRQYPGAGTLLVKKPDTLRILVQSGYTVGQGFFLRPAEPLYPDRLLDRPKVKFTAVDLVQMRTEWSYTMALEPSGDNEFDFMDGATNKRPGDIDYVGPAPGGTP